MDTPPTKSERPFTHSEMRSAAVLCGSAALLIGVAVFLSNGEPRGGPALVSFVQRAAQTAANLAPQANLAGVAAYGSAGSYTWTAPFGVTSVAITVVAGGGGSGGSRSMGDFGGAGGGGAGGIIQQTVAVTPGQSYSVVVGRGGIAGVNSNSWTNPRENGGPGEASSFGSHVASGGRGSTTGPAGGWGGGGAGGSPQNGSVCVDSFYEGPSLDPNQITSPLPGLTRPCARGADATWYVCDPRVGGINGSSWGNGAAFPGGCYSAGRAGQDGYVSISYADVAVPSPSLSISVNPNPVTYGKGTGVSWSATGGGGYDACYLGGGEWGDGMPVGTSGSLGTSALTVNTQYWYQCHDIFYGWQGPVYATATVGAPPTPSATISASPSSVYTGQSSTITWSSTNASSCSVSGPGIAASGTSGSQSTGALSTSGTKTYTIDCSGTGGTSSGSATVTVDSLPSSCSGPYCSVSLDTACQSSVLPGQACTLTWSCNSSTYTSSTGDSHYSTGGALSGSATVTPADTTTYTLYCKAGSGQTTGTASVTVLQPSLSITASPSKVKKGNTSTISWSASNVTANSCRVTGTDGASYSGATGTQTPTIQAATTYTLTCSVSSGPVSQSVTVGLIPGFQEI